MTESIGVQVVSADGRTGASLRMVRDGGTASLVAVVVTAEGVWASVAESLAASPARGVDSDLAVYEVSGPVSATFTRRGVAGLIEGVDVVAAVSARREDPPARAILGIEMTFDSVVVQRPSSAAGNARAEVKISVGDVLVTGYGVVTEGEAAAGTELVVLGQHLIAGVSDGAGWAWRDTSTAEATTVTFDPTGDDRAISLTLVDLTTIEGRLALTRTWTTTVGGTEVTESLVTGRIGGSPVSGWLTERP